MVATNLSNTTRGAIKMKKATCAMPVCQMQLLAEELSLRLSWCRGLGTSSAVRLSNKEKGDDQVALASIVHPRDASAAEALEKKKEVSTKVAEVLAKKEMKETKLKEAKAAKKEAAAIKAAEKKAAKKANKKKAVEAKAVKPAGEKAAKRPPEEKATKKGASKKAAEPAREATAKRAAEEGC